jgi:hypothetical protein
MYDSDLYRLLATKLPGYSHNRAQTLFGAFIDNYGEIIVGDKDITIKMNRKRTLPLLRESIPEPNGSYQWLCGKKLIFTANTRT